MSSHTPGPLLTVRAAVVLLLAVVSGVIAGGLSYLSDPSVPAAVRWGGGAAAGALVLFHSIVER
jgi:hypothetical protein